MVKRYYSIKYSVKRNSGKSSAMITISTQLAGMLSTIIGGLFLDNEQFLVLAFVSLIILFASIIPLFMIKEKKEEKTKPSKYKDILKQIPRQNYFILFLYESLFFINLLFPLYLFLYVENTFSFIGIINVFIGLSSILFVLFFSNKMDKNKKDYLRLITFLLGIIFLMKLNTFNPVMIALIALIEGYLSKMHTTSYNRDIWFLGKSFNTTPYNFILETITNASRFIIVLIFISFDLNIVVCLYLCILLFIFSSLFKFDDKEGGYN